MEKEDGHCVVEGGALRVLVQGELGSVAICTLTGAAVADFCALCTAKMWLVLRGHLMLLQDGSAIQNTTDSHRYAAKANRFGSSKSSITDCTQFAYRLDQAVRVILLNGWIKDKPGKAREEKVKIRTGLSYYGEYWKEQMKRQEEPYECAHRWTMRTLNRTDCDVDVIVESSLAMAQATLQNAMDESGLRNSDLEAYKETVAILCFENNEREHN